MVFPFHLFYSHPSADPKYWYLESVSTSTLTVESRPVSGDLADRRVPVQRAAMEVNCTSARDLYELMISPEGFAIIDPVRVVFRLCH
jgi:hypothetical protein